jgi:hypothetical protein
MTAQTSTLPYMKTEIAPLVRQIIEDRVTLGKERYGQTLHAFNGRDALQDAIEEAADLLFYLVQAKWERDNPSTQA